jgi:hypothetical protein
MSQKSIISLLDIQEGLIKLEESIKKTEKGLRLTNYQKENISYMFDEFVQNMNNLEQKSFEKNSNLYIFSEEYQFLTMIKDYLYKKPFSVFACFKCKTINSFQKQDNFLKEKKKIFHICSFSKIEDLTEQIIGEGVTTNWKTLYFLFYKDTDIRTHLMKYLKYTNKEKDKS